MNKHLSQDQISSLILGKASPEEEEHGFTCPKCKAELIEFRESVSRFQNVMRTWSEGEIVPKLERARDVSRSWSWLHPQSLRWAMVGVAAVVILAVLPIHKQREPETGAESAITAPTETETSTVANEDVLLMQEVTAHLSRPLPMSMERVMALLPEGDASILEKSNTPEGEVVQ